MDSRPLHRNKFPLIDVSEKTLSETSDDSKRHFFKKWDFGVPRFVFFVGHAYRNETRVETNRSPAERDDGGRRRTRGK